MTDTRALTETQQKAIDLRNYLNGDRIKEQIAAALPKWLTPDRFLRVVFGAALRNPKILDCSTESILQSVMMCAQLGLEPILGRAYLVPYWNAKKQRLECQFQPGYQGLADLARRSGMIQDIYAQVVYENDTFEIEYGTQRRITHKPTLTGDPGRPIGSYAVWEFKDGTKTFEFMPMRDIHKRREKSQAYAFAETGDPAKGGGKRDSIWHQWEEEQMRKTVVKHSAKLVPSSIEFMEAVQVDDASESGRRVQLFQTVPMIDEHPSGPGPATEYAGPDGQPDPPAWCSEILALADEAPLFGEFVRVSIQANRSTEFELRLSANGNPQAFIAAYQKWFGRQQQSPADKQAKPRKERSDKGQPRNPPAQPPAQQPAQQPPPALLQENIEATELDALRADLNEKAKIQGGVYIMQAQRELGFAIGVKNLPPTIDGCRVLIEKIDSILELRPPK